MSAEKIKQSVAPCGLCCETCFAHVDGDIRRYGMKLKEKLGSFHIYAERFETLMENPIFAKYPDFKEMLDYFASKNCTGCRNEQCKLFKGCGVRVCHQEKEVDFCFQCDQFPCGQTNFEAGMYKNWVKINEMIKSKGLETYYDLVRNRPRYP